MGRHLAVGVRITGRYSRSKPTAVVSLQLIASLAAVTEAIHTEEWCHRAPHYTARPRPFTLLREMATEHSSGSRPAAAVSVSCTPSAAAKEPIRMRDWYFRAGHCMGRL